MTDIGFDWKRRYTPSEEKRFAISSDTYSRERIKTMKNIYMELKQKLPRISIAFSLGGSLAKGKELTATNSAETDIDLYIFYDNEDVKTNYVGFLQENPAYTELFDKKAEIIRHRWAERRGHSEEEYVNQVAGSEVVREYMSNFIKTKMRVNLKNMGFTETTFEKGCSIIPDAITVSEHNSIMDRFRRYEDSLGYPDYFGDHPQQASALSLAKCFYLDIGGGFKKYRQEFLRQLAAMGKVVADNKWQHVKSAIEGVERAGAVPDKIKSQYPQTFTDACRYYGVNIE